MAKPFKPSGFSDSARTAAVARFEAAKPLAEALLAEIRAAREILREDAGDEGLAFSFFQGEISDVSEVGESMELLAKYWAPENSES